MAVAIVAIPADDDDVWQVSSEEVPHMTLLFLGEQANNPKIGEIADYLKHVAHMSMSKFGLTVDRRGTLGPDEADVLFFEKKYDEFKMVLQARDFLLENPVIREAYDSVEQYDGWTPHLTMGYPASPAKPDTREYKRFSWVRFDRVALWVGDFTGPEYRLEDDYSPEARMSTDSVIEDVLAHHGVKGMKWGVRKEETISRLNRVADGTASRGDRAKTFWGVGTYGLGGAHGIQPGAAGRRADRMQARVNKKGDKKFEQDLTGVKGFIKVNNAIADKINPRLDVINAKSKYDVNMLAPEHAATHKSYLNEYRSALQKSLDEVSADIGMNASGTKKLQLSLVGSGLESSWDARLVDIEHADGEAYLRITPQFDRTGKIISQAFHVVTPEQGLSHDGMSDSYAEMTDEVADIWLAHYGVKGMKWGVHRDRSAVEVSVTQKRPGTRVQATGGKNHPAHEDAIRSASTRRKAKASTTDALSNQELKQLVERMNLEANYARLSAPQKSAGRKLAEKLLLNKQYREQTIGNLPPVVKDIGGVIRGDIGATITKTDLSDIGN